MALWKGVSAGSEPWQCFQGVVLRLLPYDSEKLLAPALLAPLRDLMAHNSGEQVLSERSAPKV